MKREIMIYKRRPNGKAGRAFDRGVTAANQGGENPYTPGTRNFRAFESGFAVIVDRRGGFVGKRTSREVQVVGRLRPGMAVRKLDFTDEPGVIR